MRSAKSRFAALTGVSVLAVMSAWTPAAGAASRVGNELRLERIDALLADQARQIAAQNDRLAAQGKLIADQQAQLDALRASRLLMAPASPSTVASAAPVAPAGDGIRPAAGQSALTPPPPSSSTQVAEAPEAPLSGPTALPASPVGEAPEEKIRPSLLAAIPEGMGVLTPRQRFVFEPSVEYDRSGANRLVFQGVEIVPGLQLGLVNATTADRNVVVATGDLRYGLTDRIEIEARAPFLYRNDRITTLAQAVVTGAAPVNQTMDLSGANIGDVELAARYQINAARRGIPPSSATCG